MTTTPSTSERSDAPDLKAGGDLPELRAERLRESLIGTLVRRGLSERDVMDTLGRRRAIALARTQRPYTSLRAELQRVRPMGAAADAELQGLQNRLLAAALAERFTAAGAPIVLTDEVRALYPWQHERMVRGLEERDDPAFYSLDNDDFLKELAILAHRLVPYGRAFADPWGKAPVGVLVRRGVGQFLRGVRVFGLATRGFGPFLALHLHSLDLPDREDPDGWHDSHYVVAELLALNPGLRGELGGGWTYDPRISEISPNLAYLRRVPTEGGATALYSHQDVGGSSGALARSRTRQALFERGEYVPEVWICVWPRRTLLRWARKHPRIRPERRVPGAPPDAK